MSVRAHDRACGLVAPSAISGFRVTLDYVLLCLSPIVLSARDAGSALLKLRRLRPYPRPDQHDSAASGVLRQ